MRLDFKMVLRWELPYASVTWCHSKLGYVAVGKLLDRRPIISASVQSLIELSDSVDPELTRELISSPWVSDNLIENDRKLLISPDVLVREPCDLNRVGLVESLADGPAAQILSAAVCSLNDVELVRENNPDAILVLSDACALHGNLVLVWNSIDP